MGKKCIYVQSQTILAVFIFTKNEGIGGALNWDFDLGKASK